MSTPDLPHLLVTGPISGTLVTVVNGENVTVDVTPDVIELPSQEAAEAVAGTIYDLHVQSGHIVPTEEG